MTDQPSRIMQAVAAVAPNTAAKLDAIPEHKRAGKKGRTIGGIIVAFLALGGALAHWNQYLVAGLGILAGSVAAGDYVTAPFSILIEGAVRLVNAVRGKSAPDGTP